MHDKLYYYKAHVDRVKDGDTIVATVDFGFHGSFVLEFRIYQDDPDAYFDTPETKRYKGVSAAHKKHGLEAAKFAKELIEDKDVILRTYKEGSFRWLAEVWYQDGEEWIEFARMMRRKGFQKKEKYEDE